MTAPSPTLPEKKPDCPFRIPMPSVAEMEDRARKQAEDRRRRSSLDLFNPTNLGHWIALCAQADVPFVPAEEIARAPLEDVLRFETPTPALRSFWHDLETGMQDRGKNWMVRWACCSCAEVKSRLGNGQHEWHPDLVKFFGIDDFRAYDILFDFPEETVAAYARPWVKAQIVSSYPREYRVFVESDAVIGISNYYPQRPMPNDAETLADLTACFEMSRRLIDFQIKPLNCPPLETHWDISKNHWTADFIKTEDNRLLFLEGGPPFTPSGGAHPCCFMGRAPEGIALAAAADGLASMGLEAYHG